MYRFLAAMVVAIGLAATMTPAWTIAGETPEASAEKKFRSPDVIFVPTPDEVIEKMLDMAEVKKGDVVYDLGCGDGRIVVAAAKRGAKATGWDINPERVKEAVENVKKNHVEQNAKIIHDDIFTLDLSGANVITLYLLPSLNVKLIPQLEKLPSGSRIVSHDFNMEGVKPDQVEQFTCTDGGSHTIYLWTTPLKKEKKEEEKKEAGAKKEFRRPDVIYVPTPHEVVSKMLDMAKVAKGEVVYDLGCGDGRIVVAAAKRGAKATGWDINAERVREARENVKNNHVEQNAKILHDDIFTLDLSSANVVTLYLLTSLNEKLIPQLEKLKPGSRIVSHDFSMPGVKPDEVVEFEETNGSSHTIYLWTTPLKKEKKEKDPFIFP